VALLAANGLRLASLAMFIIEVCIVHCQLMGSVPIYQCTLGAPLSVRRRIVYYEQPNNTVYRPPMLYCCSECCCCCLCCCWREYYSTSMRCWFGCRYISRHNHCACCKHNEKHTSCDAITSEITTLWHDKMLSITTTTITINNVKRDRKRIWRTDRLVGVFLSGVARIWCQEGHKSYCVFTLGDCRHCKIVYYEERN